MRAIAGIVLFSTAGSRPRPFPAVAPPGKVCLRSQGRLRWATRPPVARVRSVPRRHRVASGDARPGCGLSLPRLFALTLNPAPVVGGNVAQGTVRLSGPAPANGAEVALGASGSSSSRPSAASVPRFVTVPEGATSTTFAITTKPVTVSDGALILAAFRGAWKEALLSITPTPPPGPVFQR